MKDILISGSAGFLGKKIYSELNIENNVETLDFSNSTYNYDLRTKIPLFNKRFDLVIHAAGKAHSIPKNHDEKKTFFDVNVDGTSNFLNSLKKYPPKNIIYISSVAVYGLTKGHLINEDHKLLAKDPYGKSKILAEDLIKKWGKNNDVKILILRLPLLAGPNPPGNLGKMINAIKNGYYFNIGNKSPKKSIVLLDDISKHIIKFYGMSGTFNLTDGHNPTISQLSKVISKQFLKPPPKQLPFYLMKIMSFIGNYISFIPFDSDKFNKLTSELTFDDSNALQFLGWRPSKVLNNFIIN